MGGSPTCDDVGLACWPCAAETEPLEKYRAASLHGYHRAAKLHGCRTCGFAFPIGRLTLRRLYDKGYV